MRYHKSYNHYFSLILRKMSNIMKIFQRGTKEHDLSDKSETGEDPKEVREGSVGCSQISQTSDIPNDTLPKV